MVPEESVAFAFLFCEYLKGKMNRNWWVHPINDVRHRDEHSYTLDTPQGEDPAKFLNYFRMKASTFDEILSCVQNHLKKSDITMRVAIEPEEVLDITIGTTPEENVIIQERQARSYKSRTSTVLPSGLLHSRTQSCDVIQ
jgi:hypothetical protein